MTDAADASVPGSAAPAGDAGDRPTPEGSAAPVPPRPPVRRLSLGDPLNGPAAEDRPESWGERSESDSERLAHYRAQRPPHHGG